MAKKEFYKTSDAWGNIKTSKDPAGNLVTYSYNSNGKPKSVTTGGATFTMEYDAVGNQTKLIDPNAGTYTYEYDAAGRVVKQTDGKGIITENTYDNLGRLVITTIDGTPTYYTYGEGNDWDGIVQAQTGNNIISYTYDQFGRLISENRPAPAGLRGGINFLYFYNVQGQLSSKLYLCNQSSLQINSEYDAYGNLIKLLSAQSQSILPSIGNTGVESTVIWQSTGDTGTESTALLGGTLTSKRTDTSEGLLQDISTKLRSTGTIINEQHYDFDAQTGNLLSRQLDNAATEYFTYDNLDRLTKIDGVSTINMQYAANGNITNKTGIGNYTYNGGKPHAVSEVDNTSGLINTNPQTITYTAFNKISSIDETLNTNHYSLTVNYGPDMERFSTCLYKNGVLTKSRLFAGDYEETIVNGLTTRLYYIAGGDGLAAVYVKQSYGQQVIPDRILYVVTDHLGSITKLVDGSGTEYFAATYDAWGNRTITNNTFGFDFDRGYTGHEHLDEFGLINMNGRVYDPVLGRFLSPDPFVQMPDNTQNFNRYSYCLNNPLKYTDPSGQWFGIDDLLVAVTGFTVGYLSNAISSGNWGWSSVQSGLMTAASAWIGYNTAGLATWAMNSSTWNTICSMALTNVVNQFMPPMSIPIGDHFGISMSTGLGFGTMGLTGGVNLGLTYTDGDFSFGASVGAGNNFMGWNAAAKIGGWGAGYGRSYYEASTVMGHEFGKQTVGTGTVYFPGKGSFSLSNDLFGDGEDRWRSSAAELTIGKFSIGTYIYTNWGEEEGESINPNLDIEAPGIGKNPLGAWKRGQVYFAPAYIGYKQGNQVTRIGLSHWQVQNWTQNFVHAHGGNAPFYLNYDDLYTGVYYYSGYNNPISIWE